jgi:AcrR family transcriptional regulator
MSPARRPRRTKAAVEAAITEAVRAELAERGYAALTFEGVARRAQVSKPVLYRRHPSRFSLVQATLRERAEALYTEPPRTGSLRTDLMLWLDMANEEASRLKPATFRGLVGDASEQEIRQVAKHMNARMHDVERCVLGPARQRGEISGNIPSSVARSSETRRCSARTTTEAARGSSTRSSFPYCRHAPKPDVRWHRLCRSCAWCCSTSWLVESRPSLYT